MSKILFFKELISENGTEKAPLASISFMSKRSVQRTLLLASRPRAVFFLLCTHAHLLVAFENTYLANTLHVKKTKKQKAKQNKTKRCTNNSDKIRQTNKETNKHKNY